MFLGSKPLFSLGSESLRALPGRGAIERGVRAAGLASHTHGVLYVGKVTAQVGAQDGEGQATLRGASQGLNLQQERMAMGSPKPHLWGVPGELTSLRQSWSD